MRSRRPITLRFRNVGRVPELLRHVAPAALLSIALFVAPPAGFAQSSTSGALTGLIIGTDGIPLDGVDVTLVRGAEQDGRTLTATREGRFQAAYLPPGDYDLVVERFGFIPVHISSVPIRAGRTASLTLTLRDAEPPVTETDRFHFSEVGSERALGAGRGISRDQLDRLPLHDRTLGGVLARWSLSGGEGAMGLSPSLLGLQLDGMRHAPIHHPRTGPGFLRYAALSPLFIQGVELVPQTTDVEWGGAPGGGLRATSVQGGNRLEVEAFANAMGASLGSEGPLGAGVDSRIGPEGGVLVRGPILRDTLLFAVGVEARRAARAISPIAASSAEERGLFLDAIGDGSQPASTGLGTTRVEQWDVLSTFGRLDWRLAANHTLTLRSNVSTARPAGGGAEPAPALGPPDGSRASDVMFGATLFSILGERSALELRFGAESSSREHARTGGLPSGLGDRTWIHDGGILAGNATEQPGTYEDRGFRFSPVLHLRGRDHQFKVGLDVASLGYEESSVSTPITAYGYGSVAAFGSGLGVTERITGPRREVAVDRATLGVFIQDRWSPTEDLAITVGVRAAGEALPLQEILPNELWAQRTGLTRTGDEGSRGRVSPRVHLDWSPGTGPGWGLEASAGIYHGEVSPAVLAEILADTGAVQVRRTLGTTATGTTSTALAYEGSTFSIPGPRYDAPRTQALDLAIRRDLAPGITAEIGVGLRQTDFLPRRRDLNRVPSSFALDQFDRPLFGDVVRHEGVIGVRPGSDRRFADFDVVSALESDGWSRWLGWTAGLAYRTPGPLEFEAWYTFSDTRDNMPQGATGWPNLVPGRPGSTGAEPAWVEGRSDLDVPHRAVFAGSIELLQAPELRIGALYSFRSGTPFTPGVRDFLHGSDPLGPGAAHGGSGAPISMPSGMEGLGELTSEWPCLGDLVGAPRSRNTCRTGGLHDLGMNLSMALVTGGTWQVRLHVEALNLLDSRAIIPDPALFVVDSGRELGSPSGGRLELPVKVNPNFGEPLAHLSPGRSLRVGLGLRY
ncbi:MAG: carboxypeptidase regulatory-like domain-containing protein [Gemmatimonadota bacterium]